MRSFVKWYGEVPDEARRIEEFEANEHAAPWIRRNVGLGIAYAYVIGFQADTRWWTLFFDRIEEAGGEDLELWKIESYSNAAPSWVAQFRYRPRSGQWWQAQDSPSPGEPERCS